MRPESNDKFHIAISGRRYFNLFSLETYIEQHAKTFTVSGYDALIDDEGKLYPTEGDWVYNDAYESSYYDDYWYFNPLEKWTDIENSKLWGNQYYFD